jgi:hypothetical protein
VVQAPEDLQNYNAYSYVLNSPLRYTDPTGHCFFGLDCIAVAIFAAFAGTAMIIDGNKYWKMVGSVLTFWALGPGGGLVEAGIGAAVGPMAASAYAAEISILSSAIAGGYTGFVASNGDIGAAMVAAFTAGAFTTAGLNQS